MKAWARRAVLASVHLKIVCMWPCTAFHKHSFLWTLNVSKKMSCIRECLTSASTETCTFHAPCPLHAKSTHCLLVKMLALDLVLIFKKQRILTLFSLSYCLKCKEFTANNTQKQPTQIVINTFSHNTSVYQKSCICTWSGKTRCQCIPAFFN